MGAGASTGPGAPGSAGGPRPPQHSPRNNMSSKTGRSLFGGRNSGGFMQSVRAMSAKTMSTEPTARQQKVIRVPLHIAVQAVILIQRAVRGYLARKRYIQLIQHRDEQIDQAQSYLQHKLQHAGLDGVPGQVNGSGKSLILRRSLSNDHGDHTGSSSNIHGIARNVSNMINRATGVGGTMTASSRKGMPSPSMRGGKTGSPQAMRGNQQPQLPFLPPNRLHFGMFTPLAFSGHNPSHDNNHQQFGFGPFPPDAEIEIMPLVGFVIKSKLSISGKKVFINICHSPHIDCLVATPLREWIDNNHHDDDGEVKMIDILVTDILIPSVQFDEYIKYKHGQGQIETIQHVKEFIAMSCIEFWNTLYTSHLLNGSNDEEDDEGEQDEDLGDLGNFNSLHLDDHHGGLFRRDNETSHQTSKKSASSASGNSSIGGHGHGHTTTKIHRNTERDRFNSAPAHGGHGGHNKTGQQQYGGSFDDTTILQQQLQMAKPRYLSTLGENDSDYLIDVHGIKLPKIKRSYVGRICNLIYNRYSSSCDYLEPLTLRDQQHSLVNMVNSCQADCDAIVPPPEIHSMTALAWSTVKIAAPNLGTGGSTTAEGGKKKKKKAVVVGTPGKEKKRSKTPKDKLKKTASGLGPEAISEEDGDNEDTEAEKDKDADDEKDKEKDKEKEKDKGDITSSQFEYMKQLKQLKEGYVIYCEVYMGMMYMYEKRLATPYPKIAAPAPPTAANDPYGSPARAQTSHKHGMPGAYTAPSTAATGMRAQTAASTLPPSTAGGNTAAAAATAAAANSPLKALSNSPLNDIFPPTKCLPAGDKEICRILLSHMDISTSFDEMNDLHYLHLELTSDEVDSPFNIEKYYNRFPVSNGPNGSTRAGEEFFPHRIFGTNSDDVTSTNSTTNALLESGKKSKPGTAMSVNFTGIDRDKDKNTVNGNIIKDIHKITFQFVSYSELIAWKLFFQGHIDFSFDLLRKIANFGQLPNSTSLMKFHNLLITSQPLAKSFNCQERNRPPPGSINFNNKALKRRKFYGKLDRGYLGLFMDDITVTPTWSTALEILPLKYCHLEVKHKKVIRLRNKCLTRVTLLTRDTRREFFITSELGETDPEIVSLLSAWQDNIDYANSMLYRYLAPWLKDIDMLKNPNANTNPSPVVPSTATGTRVSMKAAAAAAAATANEKDYVTCLSSGVQFQITVPEPSTSDDDSDLEDGEKMDEDWEVNQFRIVKPKQPPAPVAPPATAASTAGGTLGGASSTASLNSSLTSPAAKGSTTPSRPTLGGPSSSARASILTTAAAPTPVAPITPQPPSAPSGPANNRSTILASPRGRIGSVLGSNTSTTSSSATTNSAATALSSIASANTANSSQITSTPEGLSESEDGPSWKDGNNSGSMTFYDKVMNWKTSLTKRFEKFPPSLRNRYFHGHILYIQESQLLVMMYEFRVFMILHLSKCIEVISTKRSGAGVSSGSSVSSGVGRLSPSGSSIGLTSPVLRKKGKTTISSIVAQEKTNKFYNLDSSDEEEEDPNNSDRDYENFDDDDEINAMANGTVGQLTTTMNDTTHTYMLILMGYDGRKYKLKFYNKHDFYDWRQLFLDHDPSYARAQQQLARTGSAPAGMNKISGFPSLSNVASAASSFLAGRTSTAAGGSSNANAKENSLSLPSLTGGPNGAGGRSGSLTFDPNSFATESDKLPDITYDNESTKKFSKQLRNGERVIGCGQVMKHERVMHNSNATNAPKQRRILLVTDLPRMIYIDTIGNVVRGSTELVQESKMELKTADGNDFEINVSGNINRFTAVELPEKDGKYWIIKVRQAVSKL